MSYIDYHNAQADLFAQRYYALDYDECTLFMQLIVDQHILNAFQD
jgi:hypothetical protein